MTMLLSSSSSSSRHNRPINWLIHQEMSCEGKEQQLSSESQQLRRWQTRDLMNRYTGVRIQASALLKGEGVSHTFWCQSDPGGEVIILLSYSCPCRPDHDVLVNIQDKYYPLFCNFLSLCE